MIKKVSVILLFLGQIAGAQSPSSLPKGVFLEDSIKIGEPLNFSLVYSHSSRQEVFFPDKGFNYAPFEFIDKIYFPTETKNGISKDSAVYQLRSFDITNVQKLALPVFLFKNSDSIRVFSIADSIIIGKTVLGDFSKQKLQEKTWLFPMKQKINLINIFLQILFLAVLATIWWLIFGKTVLAQIKVFTLYRRHVEFKSTFSKLTGTANKANIEKALALWKKYSGRLQRKSFITMTTTEILENIPNENLSTALKEIDKSIYGNLVSENIGLAFDTLNTLADDLYKNRKKEYAIRSK